MKKKVICLILSVLPIYSALSDSLEEIDRAVDRISAYIKTTIQDREGLNIAVEPFLSDRKNSSGYGILGQRISSLLELNLVSVYKHTIITHSLDADSIFTVSGEIQPYQNKVRVVIRIIKSDGSLAGGMYTDIKLTPEINALIGSGSSLNQGAEQPPPVEDQFEPDDNPGFEVEIQPKGKSVFERNLTFQDIDRFIFQLTDKKSVEISAVTDIDIKILIFREGDDFPIASNTGTNGLKASPIDITLDAGIYLMEISGLIPYVTGEYKLEINFTENKGTLNGASDTGQQAAEIKPGERQRRSITAGGIDWIKPQAEMPGFYSLTVKSTDAALGLAVYSDKNLKLLFNETGNSPDKPVTAGLFLGIESFKVAVKTASPNNEPVYYSAVLADLNVKKVYPDGIRRNLNSQGAPSFFLLRIILGGKYTISFKHSGTDIKVFTLPTMTLIKGIYNKENPFKAVFLLDSGDYLIKIESGNINTENYISINGR
ncbi:MAG: hypothetical protein DRP57_05365 [Spirochaetes bacterium]|nr:MAG: hypothetical protein DRP57_05365 [Spirochaetota bacterium]